MMSIQDLQREAYDIAVRRGQWEGSGFKLPQAALKAIRREATEFGRASSDEEREEELADIVIACFSSAEALGYDLLSAIDRKMRRNRERAINRA